MLECGLQVFRINVHSRRGDDHVFFAAFEEEIAFGIEFADIAGMVPAFLAGDRAQFSRTPVAGRDTAAAHQNFSVRRKLHLASCQNFANRAFAGLERMVHADERSGFSQAVALNHGKAQSTPELFGVTVESGASGDEGPKLPSELAMDAAENPPAVKEMLALRGRVLLPEILDPARIFKITRNLFF